MRKLIAGLAVALMVASACGGSDADTTNAAALEDPPVPECVKAPVAVGGISVLGQRVQGISDVEVCTDTSVKAGVVPQMVQQPDCGDPCFTIEVRDLDLAADHKVIIKMKRDGQDVAPISFDPEPVHPTSGHQTGRVCVVGYGGPPDPCAERLTTPKQLTASPGKTKVSLTWTASKDTGDDDITGYEIWRSSTGEEGSYAYVTVVPQTSTVDMGLVRKTPYWYYVVAVDADGHRSLASNVATVTTK